MVDGGVDRVDVDAARNRIWRRCRKNVQLSVGDVIVMLKKDQYYDVIVISEIMDFSFIQVLYSCTM